MIAVCEPSCVGASHETPNAGFIAALTKCFPGEEITFYGEKQHLNIIKGILEKKRFSTRLVRFRPIFVSRYRTIFDLPLNLCSCWNMLRELTNNKCNRVLFLSAYPVHAYAIKKMCGFFANIKCTFVLHGDLEALSGETYAATPVIVEKKTILERLRGKSLAQLCARARDMLWDKLKAGYFRFCTLRFDIRKTLPLLQETGRFNHIALSPHIEPNLSRYIDTAKLNLHTITMPAVFSAELPARPINAYVKFGIFGYGNAGMLQRLNMALAKLDIRQNYEIRIIGADGRGVEGYPQVTQPISGRPLTREEMEELVRDIDMQMILYEDFLYKLSCSASIIEAHVYAKPIIYLKNECMDAFNPPEKPIGIRCADVKEMAEQMHRIIDIGGGIFQEELEQYYQNILFHRKRIDIMNNLHTLKNALS